MTEGVLRRFAPVVVMAATCAAFWPALDGEFLNWDDNVNFLDNARYRGLGWANLKWMFTATLTGHYIPLTWISLGLNYELGGLDPFGYHLGNLLIHTVNAGLLYLIARRLLSAALDGQLAPGALSVGAGAAALAWSLHPLRVESVAWTTERRDVLCGAFYLAAVLAYLRGTASRDTIRGGWLAVSLAAFAAALLSKAIAMTLPLSLVVLDTYPLRRWGLGWRRVLLEKLPYAALGGAGAVVAVLAVARGAAWTGLETHGVSARAAMVGYSLWFYPWKLVWPVGLSPLYELPQRIDPWQGRFVVPMVAVLVVTAGLIGFRRRWPAGLAAWLHSAVALGPVNGAVHVGYQLAHDRYSYLSGLGFALLAGGAVAWLFRARAERRIAAWIGVVAAAGVILVLLGWSAAAWRQSKLWYDSETLWRWAVDVDPRCALCHNNLAVAIIRAPPLPPARAQEAERHLRQAIAVRPDRSEAYLNLGVLLARQARYAEADPFLLVYTRLTPGLPEGVARLGMLRVDQGRFAQAVPLLRAALRMDPRHPLARADLARALAAVGTEQASRGHRDEALALVREGAALRPDAPEALSAVGEALVKLGQGAEALAPLERAAALAPRRAPTRFWLARAHLLAGDEARARAEIDALRDLDPGLAARVRARE